MALKGPMATLRGNREGKQQKVEENDEENEEESKGHFRGIWEEPLRGAVGKHPGGPENGSEGPHGDLERKSRG